MMKLQEAVINILETSKIANQSELSAELEKLGISVNQSTLSRVLKKIQVSKVSGYYALPHIKKNNSDYFDFLHIIPSGDTLLVVKTSPGSASRVAYHIDGQNLKGIAGTISGDDTIFVAIKSKADKEVVTKAILNLFNK